MAKIHFTLDPTKRTIPLLFTAQLLALAAFQHMIVLYLVFPALDSNLLRWIVPSRSSNGIDTLLDTSEFTVMSLSFMAIMGILFVLTAFLIRFKKDLAAFFSLVAFSGVSFIWFTLTFGNVFGDLWNAWAAVIGVLIAVGIIFISELPVFKAFKSSK